jgi:hypothetical protein
LGHTVPRYNSFAFGRVNLAAATAELIACIPKTVTVHEAEWIAHFNDAGTLLATASGDTEVGSAQLLVFDTRTAGVVLETSLDGLAKALGAYEGLFAVWAVAFD